MRVSMNERTMISRKMKRNVLSLVIATDALKYRSSIVAPATCVVAYPTDISVKTSLSQVCLELGCPMPVHQLLPSLAASCAMEF